MLWTLAAKAVLVAWLIAVLAACPLVRTWAFRRNVLHGSRAAKVYEVSLGKLLLVAYMLLILVPAAAGFLVLDPATFSQQTFSLLLGGVAAATFAAIQLPKLLPPRVFVSMMPERDGAYVELERTLVLQLHLGQEAIVFFQLTSMGSNNYSDCALWVDFEDKSFEPLEAPKNVDFAKSYDIHKQNKTAVFKPKYNYQDIAATNHLVLPVRFKCPDKAGDFIVRVGITTKDRWGETSVPLKLTLT